MFFFTYLRGVLHWIIIFFLSWGLGIFVIFFGILGKHRFKNIIYFIIRIWSFFVLKLAGISIFSKNNHVVPSKGSFVTVFNHTSYVDILALFYVCPRALYFGAKKELFYIPLLGWAMWASGQLLIERSKAKTVYKLYLSLNKRIKKGDCFALAPEGKRHTGKSPLAQFKKGPFVLALKHQLPILPVLIRGSKACMPKGSLLFNTKAFRSKVFITWLSPIESSDFLPYSFKNANKLKEQAYQTMLLEIKKNR